MTIKNYGIASDTSTGDDTHYRLLTGINKVGAFYTAYDNIDSGKYGCFNIRFSAKKNSANWGSEYLRCSININSTSGWETTDGIFLTEFIFDTDNRFYELKGVLLNPGEVLTFKIDTSSSVGINYSINANGYIEDVNNPI